MAEQYASFQGKEPNIDVNLFVNALTQGIAAGNAQDSTFSAITKGVTSAIKTGIDTTQGIQQIQANDAANQVNTDPGVIDAKKRQAKAEADKAEAEAAAYKDGSAQAAKAQKAKTEAAKNKQEYDDITTKQTLDDLIASGVTGPELDAAIQKSKPTLARDNDYFQQLLAQVKDKIPADSYNALSTQANAVEAAKQQAQLQAANNRALQTQAAEKAKKFDEAASELQLNPQVKDVMTNGRNGQAYDPTKLAITSAASVELGKDGKVKFDANGMPIISGKPSNPNDKRYITTYDGEELGYTDEESGKALSKLMPDYRLGALARNPLAGTKPPAPATQPTDISQEGAGLAAQLNSRAATVNQQAIDRYGSPASAPSEGLTAEPPAEALEGKTPEQQQQVRQAYTGKIKAAEAVPPQYREVYKRVQSDPALRNQAPIVKALASVESGGKRGVKSSTGVEDLLQVTGQTFDDIQKKYPSLLPKAAKGSDEGSVLAGRIYLTEMLTQFEDLELALAAYNAGPGTIETAIKQSGVSRKVVTWDIIKPYVEENLRQTEEGTKKWENELDDYPERVLNYYRFYNG